MSALAGFAPAPLPTRPIVPVHLDKEAAMDLYRAHRETVIRVLNEALSLEIVGVQRYRRHYLMVHQFAAGTVTQRLLSHSNEEQRQADEILHRITQLRGEPDLAYWTALDPACVGGEDVWTLSDMLREDLTAERIAIATIDAMIRSVGDDDPISRRLLEGLRDQEQEHAARMADLVGALAPTPVAARIPVR